VGSGSSSVFGGSAFFSTAFIPHVAVGLEAGLFMGGEAWDPDAHSDMFVGFTVSPSMGLVFPFGSRARIFSNALLEMGWFGLDPGMAWA